MIAHTRLNYLNNRHYDSSVRVFISVDPLDTATGQPYIYGAANPVTCSDPTGLCPFSGCWEAFDAYLRGLTEAATYQQGPEEQSPSQRLPLTRVEGHAEAQAALSLNFNNPVPGAYSPLETGRGVVNPHGVDRSSTVDWILVGQVAVEFPRFVRQGLL